MKKQDDDSHIEKIVVHITITLSTDCETVPQARFDRDMQALQEQVADAFRRLVSDIQRAIE